MKASEMTIEWSDSSKGTFFTEEEDDLFKSIQKDLDRLCNDLTNLYNMWIKEKARADTYCDEAQKLVTENSILKKELLSVRGPKPKKMSYEELYSNLRTLRKEKTELEQKIDKLTEDIEEQMDDKK